MSEHAAYDVVVVGLGPVGATLANLLGLQGIKTLVLEKDDAVYRLPRAGTCDDEAMRVWQAAGLTSELLPPLLPQSLVQFLDGRRRPVFELRRAGFGYGYPGLFLLYQPFIEEVLRRGLERFPGVEVRLRAELLAYRQDAEGVVVTVKAADAGPGSARLSDEPPGEVRARYLIGCDGAHSQVRHQMGAHLVGKTFQRWLVIDLSVKDPGRFPGNFQFICDPRRPAIHYPMAFCHHRFQFMLEESETQEAMERPETAARLLVPWTDLREDAVIRRSMYVYHARAADRWQDGRVFLAGDSAHLTPPFAGQGMSSGIRDAMNLAWKLALVLQGVADPSILQSYERERRPHVEAMTRLAVRISRVLQTRSRAVAAVRDGLLRLLPRVPFVSRFLKEAGFKPAPRMPRALAAPSVPRRCSGMLFLQPRVRRGDGAEVLLDDLLGDGFAVLGLDTDPRGLVDASHDLWSRLGARFLEVRSGPAARAVASGNSSVSGRAAGSPALEVVWDDSGAVRAWCERVGARVVILRPDRFVFGAYPGARAGAAACDLEEALGIARGPHRPPGPAA